MDHLVSYLVSLAAGITLTILAKPTWLLLSGFIQSLFADLPKVSGDWIAEFNEPTEDTENNEREDMREEVKLQQMGRIVWGEGKVIDERDRKFKYRAIIVRQTLYGNYRRKGSKKPSGTGTFQLQVTGSDRKMEGWCIWHDQDTDDIEASPYEWTRKK